MRAASSSEIMVYLSNYMAPHFCWCCCCWWNTSLWCTADSHPKKCHAFCILVSATFFSFRWSVQTRWCSLFCENISCLVVQLFLSFQRVWISGSVLQLLMHWNLCHLRTGRPSWGKENLVMISTSSWRALHWCCSIEQKGKNPWKLVDLDHLIILVSPFVYSHSIFVVPYTDESST